MTINQNNTFNANLTLKDSTGVDVVVASLSANLDKNSQNFNINVNVINESLLDTANAENIAGETASAQYTEFYNAVVQQAKGLGYVIFA